MIDPTRLTEADLEKAILKAWERFNTPENYARLHDHDFCRLPFATSAPADPPNDECAPVSTVPMVEITFEDRFAVSESGLVLLREIVGVCEGTKVHLGVVRSSPINPRDLTWEHEE